MAKSKSYIPANAQSITAQIVVDDARAYAEKLAEIFDAKTLVSFPTADGKVLHSVVQIGGSKIYLGDRVGPASTTKANLFVYVPDVDATVAKIAACGGKVIAPPTDMFWGDRWALVEDPTGNQWQLATTTEELTVDEIQQRMAAAAS